jgi:hypothetical protein
MIGSEMVFTSGKIINRGIGFRERTQEKPREGGQLMRRPSVLGAVIDKGFCLDLLNTEYINLLKESYQTLIESCKTLGLPVPLNKSL